MDYMGSKTKLLTWIFEHLGRHRDHLGLSPNCKFLDGCAGTGAVACKAAALGYTVTASDMLAFPRHLIQGRLGLSPDKEEMAFTLINDINGMPDVEGFFFQEYSPAGERMFFTEGNAKRIDAARGFIRTVKDPVVQSYLYYCLIEAVNRASNTAGTHGAFMKKWKERAQVPLQLVIEPFNWHPNVTALQADVVGRGEDILYLDPPYTKRQYGPNYHLYDTVVRANDPQIKGVTGLPSDYLKSAFCKGDEIVGDLITRVLRSTSARLVIISYSSDGTLPFDGMLTQMMQGFSHEAVEVQVKAHPRYHSAKEGTKRVLSTDFLREYLFIIEREDDGVLSFLLKPT